MAGDKTFWENHYKKHGSADQSPFTSAKNDKILELIPEDVKTILDVGCGGGSLMLYLMKEGRFEIDGVDRSSSGVEHIVNTLGLKAYVGDILNLKNISDNSYDLVICSEVMEHIDVKDWEQALNELKRVSKRYILTTNPYREKLKYHQVVCNHCETRFHPVGHIHSVGEKFVQENMRPYVSSLNVYYSGKRNWTSTLFSDFVRLSGHQMVDTLNVECPVCNTSVPFKGWGVPLKIVNRGYITFQKVLGRLGLSEPATILCFMEV
ncbi:MAG: class I SAM-dependent methyltransferase [Bacteriovoracaceae bacterium]|nr:class I SAM-dependent methyltransferase [Bacteriovoracaceae bacterium]